MENLVFMLKTYSGDFNFLDRLLTSYVKFNKDSIKLFMCVPKEDFKAAQIYEKYMGQGYPIFNEFILYLYI